MSLFLCTEDGKPVDQNIQHYLEIFVLPRSLGKIHIKISVVNQKVNSSLTSKSSWVAPEPEIVNNDNMTMSQKNLRVSLLLAQSCGSPA